MTDENSTDEEKCELYESIACSGFYKPGGDCQTYLNYDVEYLQSIDGNEGFDFYSCPAGNPCEAEPICD